MTLLSRKTEMIKINSCSSGILDTAKSNLSTVRKYKCKQNTKLVLDTARSKLCHTKKSRIYFLNL
jgi:hypothetical protein